MKKCSIIITNDKNDNDKEEAVVAVAVPSPGFAANENNRKDDTTVKNVNVATTMKCYLRLY